MRYSLAEISKLIDGKVVGDDTIVISGLNGINDATADDLTFAVAPHLHKVDECSAAAVIVPDDGYTYEKTVVTVKNPRLAFVELLEIFREKKQFMAGVDVRAIVGEKCDIAKTAAIMPFAIIGRNVRVGENTIIFPHVYIGDDVCIGDNCVIYPQVTIYSKCCLGDRVSVHSGSVVGSDGFGYIPIAGVHRKVPQVGNVVVGNDVEIGSNSCIDRAATGSTIIGNGTKIDNLVHIAHNVVTGENCLFVAQVGISGSVTIGNNCTFAGQAGSAGHIKIGNNCVFAARSGVMNSVKDNSFLAGYPPQPHREWLKTQAMNKKMPAMYKRINKLEQELEQLKKLVD